MAWKKGKGTELAVFKGREARLNRVIFQTFTHLGSKIIYDVHKRVLETKGFKHTRYANVNIRVRTLAETGYLRKIGLKRTKVGLEAVLFEITTRAYLALLLNTLNIDDLIGELDEPTALTLLSSILSREQT